MFLGELEDQAFFLQTSTCGPSRYQVSGSVLVSGGVSFFQLRHHCHQAGGLQKPSMWVVLTTQPTQEDTVNSTKKNRLVLNAPGYRSFAHQFFPPTILYEFHLTVQI